MPVTLEKSWGNIFNDYIFEITGFHWSKWTVECALCFTLILKSAQARCEVWNQIHCKSDSCFTGDLLLGMANFWGTFGQASLIQTEIGLLGIHIKRLMHWSTLNYLIKEQPHLYFLKFCTLCFHFFCPSLQFFFSCTRWKISDPPARLFHPARLLHSQDYIDCLQIQLLDFVYWR